MTFRPPLRTWILLLLGLLVPAPAHALTLLTANKVGVFRASESTALVRVQRDPALRALALDPSCPTTSSVRLAFSPTGADFVDHGEVALPCEGWRSTRGGWRWTGAGDVQEVALRKGDLTIRAAVSVPGPVAYVEAFLTVGDATALVRLQNFRRNDATRIVSRRPSRVAAAGEAAFWDTVWGDRPRSDEALQLLQRAVRRTPKDGRSQFLLGMLHLHRSTQACATFDFANLCQAGLDEGLAAQASLDRAVPLLPQDSRIAGFRAASAYANAFVRNDAPALADGLAAIDTAVATNPLFNSFDLFAVVAPVTPGDTAYYQERILPLVDGVFQNADCLVTLPEICGNAGMAPHNFEGTLLLLGDLYAKGRRLVDAERWYAIAAAIGRAGGYRHQAVADGRVATAAMRDALYADGDPGNDPPVLGGGGGSCKYCHEK